MKKIILCLFMFFVVCSACAEKTQVFESMGMKLKIETVVQGLDIPWAFVFLPSGDLLITEKEGRILWWKKSAEVPSLQEIPHPLKIYDGGQGGLMDSVLHPQFKNNSYIYFTYSTQTEKGRTTQVSRARWNKGSFKNWELLFTALPYYSANIHFGSRMVFDPEGYLFFTIGDRRNRDLAQSLRTHNGKVMRIFPDGKIPEDNPFKGSALFSFGHRNPQGISLRKGEVWINEHGPRGGDEINLIKKGMNYGWPVVTYGKEYIGGKIGEGVSKQGMEDPKKYYVPSIAPSSMAYYDGPLFPAWRDHFLSGSLVLRHLNIVSAKDFSKEERVLSFLNKRVRDVRVGPEGFIYLAVEDGAILRIVPASK